MTHDDDVRPGRADDGRQLPDELLPRHGRDDDDDGLLADLQRVARLLVRHLRPEGEHARAGRVLPLADRHDQVHGRVDDRGARPRRLRGGRHRPPQRSLSRLGPRARAHAAEAGLLGGQDRRVRRERRAHVRGRGEDARRPLGRRDRGLPGGPAAAAREDQAARRGRRRRLEDHPLQPPHAAGDARRLPRDDGLARPRRAPHPHAARRTTGSTSSSERRPS